MRTRSKNRRAAIAILALTLGIAACGSSGSDEGSATTANADDATAATTALPEPSTSAAPSTVSGVDDSILTDVYTGSFQIGEDEPIVLDGSEIDTEFDMGDGPVPSLIGFFGEGVILVPIDLAAEGPTGDVTIFTAEGETFRGEGIVTADGDVFVGRGDVTADADGAIVTTEFTIPLGVGSSTFELDGTNAIVRGTLGSGTFQQVQHLIDNHPEVDTLVLQTIAGSVNDDVNVETGRLVRNAGLATFVPADGEIYSGGVDLFAAGTTRTAEPGATVGVHAWCCGPNGESAHELDRDDPAHETQLAYFTEMLGAEAGPEFYFFTLEAAPFDGIHPMSSEELAEHLVP